MTFAPHATLTPADIAVVVLSILVILLASRDFVTRVPQPKRALVYRLATLHRVAGPGLVFLMPAIDSIHGFLDMSPHQLNLEVPQIKTLDDRAVRTNLEVTWRINPRVSGRVQQTVRLTIVLDDDQRGKAVEEVVILMARQTISGYNLADLGRPENRETAIAKMVDAANERLQTLGLQVERIFWRGSDPSKLAEAQLRRAIALDQAEGIIQAIEAVRARLPDMQPEEFLKTHPVNPHAVFISHAHADNGLCDRYVDALQARGFDVWYDRANLNAGMSLSAEIQSQLRARRAFVVMLSKESVDSYWVQLETDAFRMLVAKERDRIILPVRIGQCEVPLLLSGLKWVDAMAVPFDQAVGEIARALARGG